MPLKGIRQSQNEGLNMQMMKVVSFFFFFLLLVHSLVLENPYFFLNPGTTLAQTENTKVLDNNPRQEETIKVMGI